MRRLHCRSYLLAAIVTLSQFAVTARADSQADSTTDHTDGPHVYWQSPTEALVFYLCDGEIERRVLSGSDTIRFTGFCSDTTTTYCIPVAPPIAEPHIFTNVSRIFAVSDVHGEYEALVGLLKNSGIVDRDLHWSWNDGHLVVDGDVFDRGDAVTECLWLIYRLEQEARSAGGRVHFIIGNHEAMALHGDLRYVHEKYLKGIARKSRVSYEDLFGPKMELGRWLQTKHAMVRVNSVLFVHGGICPEFVERGFTMADINGLVRDNLHVRSYEVSFVDDVKLMFGSKGPLWYRGFVVENRYPRTTTEEIDKIVDFYDAETVIVGHSEVEQVTGFYNGKVVAIDVPVEDLHTLQGYLWEEGKSYRVTGNGDKEPLQ